MPEHSHTHSDTKETHTTNNRIQRKKTITETYTRDLLFTTMCLSTATRTGIQKRPIRPKKETYKRELKKKPTRETHFSLPCAWAQPHAQWYKRDPYDLQKRPTKETYERDLHERLTFHYHVPEHTATRTVIWIVYKTCANKTQTLVKTNHRHLWKQNTDTCENKTQTLFFLYTRFVKSIIFVYETCEK